MPQSKPPAPAPPAPARPAASLELPRMSSAPANTDQPPLRDKVARIISLIRPAVQSDGGDIELIDVSADGIVRIRLHGACVGCPSSAVTLQMGVERNLKAHIPEIKAVQAVA